MGGPGDDGAGWFPDGAGPSPDGPGGLVDEITRWVAAERVSNAAAARARARSLAGQAAATATWAGILLDLAERQATVSVGVYATRVQGRLVGVARDFCIIESPDGHPAAVRLDAISDLTTPAGNDRSPDPPGGSRRPSVAMGLVDLLEAVAAEFAPVTVTTPSGSVHGELVALGEDVVTLRDPGPSRRLVHVPLAAVAACVLR